jgi:hypothetical protein
MSLITNSFLLGLGFFVMIPTQVQGQACADYKIVSPLTEQPQVFSDWCTAAAVQVATTHYGITLSQCDLVGAAVSSICCPLSDHTPGNDPTCHPAGIWPPEIFTTSMVNFKYVTLFYLTDSPTGPPSWTTIVDEICSDRPMVSVASVPSITIWHTVVVEGFRREVVNQGELHKVRVFDPQEDLCDSGCAPEDQNPRFFTEDAFYNSLYDHNMDYITITPKPKHPLPVEVSPSAKELSVN